MRLADCHRRAARPGLLFSERRTAGALRLEVLAGAGRLELDGRAAALVVLSGGGSALGRRLGRQDLLYLPAGTRGALDYRLRGRALLARFAAASRRPEALGGPLLVRRGQAFGYVRRQYRGLAHGWGEELAGFNPRGIVYVDKLWGTGRDVLAQELAMPPGHVVPVHAHGRLGAAPDGRGFWQFYCVWAGSARVDLGRPGQRPVRLRIGPGSVLVYPNGVAHNVVAGARGCRYLYMEKREAGAPPHLDLDAERDYERRLTLRANLSLEAFLRAESPRTGRGRRAVRRAAL